MKIAVISQIRAGSARAHAINVFKTAGGFARLGHSVTVYCLWPEDGAEGLAGYGYGEYELAYRFAPAGALSEDAEAFGRWAARAAISDGAQFVYGRNFWGPIFTAQAGVATVVETHAYVGSVNEALDRSLEMTRSCASMRGVVTIGRVLADDFVRRGADGRRVHVVPDGVDFELFDRACGREYDGSGPHVVYAGHLYDYKGIPTVIEAAGKLPMMTFHFVGGLERDRDRARERVERMGIGNVKLHGRVAHERVPEWTRGADVLLLPPSAKEASKDWTSPVKLGEYLASGAPVVVSRIPALVDVLEGEPVVWFAPDDAESLAGAIVRALGEKGDVAGRDRRRELARGLGYERRAGRILEVAGVGACAA